MAKTIKFHFKYKKQAKVTLPVNPEKLQIKVPGKNSTETLVNKGEVTILKLPGLKKISFESFIPKHYDTGAGYLSTNAGSSKNAKFWVDFFTAIMREKDPVQLTITGLDVPISLAVSVESFDYDWEGSDEDMNFKIELKEYKKFEATIVRIKRPTKPAPKQKTKEPARSNPKKAVTVGCTVILNGTVHRDSYGNGPGKTFTNYTGKVNFVKTDGRSHPYHVTTPSGGWLGWVLPGAVEVV